MRPGSLIPGAILGICLAACQSPLSSSERLRLAEGEAKWAARGYGDYSIEMRRSCFCAPEVNAWARVEVVGDWLEDIRFILDPVLGYPAEISWISAPNVQDAGATQYLRNPAPLP
jgi:hypothetical protein